MATRLQLQALSDLRLAEAQLLLDNQFWAGAYYLAGYSVEMALKACYVKLLTSRDSLPQRNVKEVVYTHVLATLVKTAELESERELKCQSNPAFGTNWSLVRDWSEESRYEKKSEQSARDLMQAITDQQEGVLPWVKSHW